MILIDIKRRKRSYSAIVKTHALFQTWGVHVIKDVRNKMARSGNATFVAGVEKYHVQHEK